MSANKPDSGPSTVDRRQVSGIVNIAAALLSTVLLVVILQQLQSLLQPLLVAVFFYYLGAPLSAWLIHRRVPAAIANLAILFAALLLLGCLTWLVSLYVDDVQRQLPHYNNQFRSMIQQPIDWLAQRLPQGQRVRDFFYMQVLEPLLARAPLGNVLGVVLGGLVASISTTLLVIFYLLFINMEASSLPRRLHKAYGPERASQFLEIGKDINDSIIRYVYVKAVASLLVAGASTAVMLSFRLDLAIFWGVFTFFGNFVPYLGSAMAVTLPLTVALLQFASLGTALLLAGLLLACQLTVANYLEPRFAGSTLNLSPLIILLSLAFWFWLWGILGMVLAVPIMVSVKLVLMNIPATQHIGLLMSLGTSSRTGRVTPSDEGSSKA